MLLLPRPAFSLELLHQLLFSFWQLLRLLFSCELPPHQLAFVVKRLLRLLFVIEPILQLLFVYGQPHLLPITIGRLICRPLSAFLQLPRPLVEVLRPLLQLLTSFAHHLLLLAVSWRLSQLLSTFYRPPQPLTFTEPPPFQLPCAFFQLPVMPPSPPPFIFLRGPLPLSENQLSRFTMEAKRLPELFLALSL